MTEQLCWFKDNYDCKTVHGGGSWQKHRMRTTWEERRRLFARPQVVEAVAKRVIILIDGCHSRLNKDIEVHCVWRYIPGILQGTW
jgi:hypothetical protein